MNSIGSISYSDDSGAGYKLELWQCRYSGRREKSFPRSLSSRRKVLRTSFFRQLIRCKNEAKLDLQQIDCFAAASGPGSFTGIRVALSAIKGLAYALGKPAIGISNLRALSSFGIRPRSLRAVVLDARRGDVYAGVYNDDSECVSPEVVTPFSNWLAHLDAAQDYEFVSPSVFNFEGTPFAGANFTTAGNYLARAVALCAERDGNQGKWLDPATVDANYVRRSDAELFWREDRSPNT